MSTDAADIFETIAKPVIKYLIDFNEKTRLEDKEIHSFNATGELSYSNALLFLSMKTVIQMHPDLKWRPLNEIFDDEKLRNIIL